MRMNKQKRTERANKRYETYHVHICGHVENGCSEQSNPAVGETNSNTVCLEHTSMQQLLVLPPVIPNSHVLPLKFVVLIIFTFRRGARDPNHQKNNQSAAETVPPQLAGCQSSEQSGFKFHSSTRTYVAVIKKSNTIRVFHLHTVMRMGSRVVFSIKQRSRLTHQPLPCIASARRLHVNFRNIFYQLVDKTTIYAAISS